MENLGNPYIPYWKGVIEEAAEEIKELNAENKAFQEIREKYQHNKEIEMTAREILHLNARCIQLLRVRIDDAKTTIKELSDIRR